MIERLPKNCSIVIDALAKTISENAELGVMITCTSSGKNKFTLMVDKNPAMVRSNLSIPEIYGLGFDYNDINISAISKLFLEKNPDFLLKPTQFMSLSKLLEISRIDKEELCNAILKAIRSTMKRAISYYDSHGSTTFGVYIANSYHSKYESISPKFTCFNEFLIWVDLNVK